MDEWKNCTMCGQRKQVEDFGMRSGRSDRQAYCRPCYRAYAKRWNDFRPKRGESLPRAEKPYREEVQAEPSPPVDRDVLDMFLRARTRAKRRGLEFSISPADVVIPETCPVLGVKLARKRSRLGAPFIESPSLDRIDNSRGYVPGNVWVISARANAVKNNIPVEGIRAILALLEKQVDILPGSGTVTP